MFNAGLTTTVRPSARAGGTLRLARTSDFDSLDPGNTYYAFAWNFLRPLGPPLVTFRPAPGAAGQPLVPDPAPPPVPPGAGHGTAPPASGPYRILSYQRGTRLELARNPHWDAATDPVRRALPDRIVADLGVDARGVDDRLLDGSADIDLAGVGVQP